MLDFNCLLKNTQLLQDISRYLEKTVLSRASKNEKVDIESIYSAMRKEGSFWDLDMNSVAYIYENAIPALKQSGVKGLSSQRDIDAATNKIIDKEVKKILFAKRQVKTEEVGRQKPSEAAATSVLQMFEMDTGVTGNVVRKTEMLQMQEAVQKAAKALLDRQGRQPKPKATFQEILQEAFRLDALGVRGLNGTMNTMDDLFNQMTEEVDRIVAQMEAKKKGQTQAKKDEIDDQIRRFRDYTAKLQQGAYTLALSQGEAKKVMLDILKEKFGKDIVVNGKTKRVIQWNKVFKEVNGVPDLQAGVEEVLRNNGFSPTQIQKINAALAVQYDNLRQSAQWQNLADNGMKKAVNDDTFLTRAANAVIMSKTDKEGRKYKVYDPELGRDVPDLARWVADGNPDITTLKSKIADDIRNKNDASGYRQIVSELARAEQKIPKVTKSDLEKLNELKKINGFDEKFNAKVYSMLGLQQSDIEAADQIEKILDRVDKALQSGGDKAALTLGSLQDEINKVIFENSSIKTPRLALATALDKFLTHRNAVRLMNPINLIENTTSGIFQLVENSLMSVDKKNRKQELGKIFNIMKDVAKGGRHFSLNDYERVNFVAHERRLDKNKSAKENFEAYMGLIPNILMGTMDSAAYYGTFRTMLKNSLITYQKSMEQRKFEEQLISVGVSPENAKKQAREKQNQEKFESSAIDKVTNALYDEQKRKLALDKAEQLLKIAKPNPTKEEIEREADNIMLDELMGDVNPITKKREGGIGKDVLKSIVDASNYSAQMAVGKQSPWYNPFQFISNQQSESRKKIQQLIKDGKYNQAANKIMLNAVFSKGILPFATASFNWTVIALKKAGLGAFSAIPLRKKDFRESIEDIARLDPSKVKDIFKKYNTNRDDIYKSFVGLAFSTILVSAVAAAWMMGDDDEEEFTDFVKDQVKELNKIPFAKKAMMRWTPDFVRIYNGIAGNYEGRPQDVIPQVVGLGTLETPLTKAFKFNSNHPAAGVGSIIGSAFDVGAYYNLFNSYADIFDEEEVPKAYRPKAHDVKWSPVESGTTIGDFINGIIFGITGYGLNKDLNYHQSYRPSK